MAILCVPIVTREQYPALRDQANYRGEMPANYDTWLKQVREEEKTFRDNGVVTVDVNIDPIAFKEWFAKNRSTAPGGTSGDDLFNYAAFVFANAKK
jgi:hypothetical protein